jgi:hypothetical protein
VPWVKEHAPEAAKQLGYEIIGYEGYTWSAFYGGMVWYTLRQTNGITYEGAFTRWGEEVHVYDLKAIDAIKP